MVETGCWHERFDHPETHGPLRRRLCDRSHRGTVEIRLPITASPRLTKGTGAQLQNIEVSPFGLHWTELDADLSFKRLLKGEF